MNKTGVYKETLWCGAVIEVTARAWNIQYIFPTMSYYEKDKTNVLQGEQVDGYIELLTECWDKYEELSETRVHEGSSSVKFAKGMTIKINGTKNGVRLDLPKLMITSGEEIEEIVACFKFAKRRAEEIRLRVLFAA